MLSLSNNRDVIESQGHHPASHSSEWRSSFHGSTFHCRIYSLSLHWALICKMNAIDVSSGSKGVLDQNIYSLSLSPMTSVNSDFKPNWVLCKAKVEHHHVCHALYTASTRSEYPTGNLIITTLFLAMIVILLFAFVHLMVFM